MSGVARRSRPRSGESDVNVPDATFSPTHQIEDAAATFGKLLEQPIGDNARAEAYHHRGDAYANLGRFGEAAADYRSAIRVVPIDSTAWGGLIQVGVWVA